MKNFQSGTPNNFWGKERKPHRKGSVDLAMSGALFFQVG
jgi:hypothetical protein